MPFSEKAISKSGDEVAQFIIDNLKNSMKRRWVCGYYKTCIDNKSSSNT